MAKNAFELEQDKHAQLLNKRPIGRTALLNSLERLRSTGGQTVRSEDVGAVRYANVMHGVLRQAIDLETKPPLTQEDRSAMQNQMLGLEAITDGNTDQGGDVAPTDADTIDTGKKKA